MQRSLQSKLDILLQLPCSRTPTVGNVRVREEIKRIKQCMTNELFIEAMDVLNKYIKIAFSDITDYLTFGQREVQVMGAFGPVED